MSYINGKEILPEDLLKEVQKYFKGGIIYIPDTNDKRRAWGSNTDIKSTLKKRNIEIKNRKAEGASFDELMNEYHLSYDSIKKIVYCT